MESDIRAIEENAALYEETNFYSRADAIDFIDFHILDRIEILSPDIKLKEKLDILKLRAEKAKYELERIDANLFKQLRENIRNGIYTKSSFNEMISKYMGYNVSEIGQPDKIGYDNLDVFINKLLSVEAVPNATIAAEPEMVFYQKTPARIILKMTDLAQLSKNDVFFDLGSGLGQVAMLVNLISGATARGIEYEPAYCDYAKACASQLNLSNVEFINTDARKGDYSKGTVFFMYTPFEGSMLQDMMEILQKESQKRTIRIFTYGPCSSNIALQTWLDCVNGDPDNHYELCAFRSLDSLSYDCN
ncbi:MAG TPA: hypothetical protein VK671_09430 [Mucilaginibacter sp.]|jgi:hypothetical protein|nr:hypothetical protein [Mucilaginibacter sp.]